MEMEGWKKGSEANLPAAAVFVSKDEPSFCFLGVSDERPSPPIGFTQRAQIRRFCFDETYKSQVGWIRLIVGGWFHLIHA